MTPEYGSPSEIMCWKARDVSSLSSVYDCGNSPCYKIRDPARDVHDAKKDAEELLIVGYILLSFGFTSGLVAAISCCLFCCKKTDVEIC